jgi:hypothetical protein
MEYSGTGWFAVRVRPGAEAKAFVGLEAAHLKVFLPVELVRITLRSRKDEVTWRPLFPGHLFAMIDPARDLPKLREIDGIDDVVRPGGRLVPVSDDAIAALRSAERRGLFDAAARCRQPGPDDPPPDVRFAGLVARIRKGCWSKERARTLMEMLIGEHSRSTV